MRRALIQGVTGQDGAYLARLLVDRGYRVTGTSRDAATASLAGLRAVGLGAEVELLSLVPSDLRSVVVALERARPDEVYALAGPSSVALSFEQPAETLEGLTLGALNLLEAVRLLRRDVRIYHAGSGEVFGDAAGPCDADAPLRPRSPYGVAKAAATLLVRNYREAYGLFACTGVLFNHDSPLRPERFVTQKVVAAACRIAAGSDERLRLGTLEVERDWGWAPEHVEAMWRLLQLERPADVVVATGRSRPLSAFVERAFAEVGLDWRDHVDVDPSLARPADIRSSRADPSQARALLGWEARSTMEDVVRRMVAARRATAPA